MINIAIDGHVGSGKSSLAKGIAQKLNYHVLDTGAIYRGLACAYKDKGYREINDENINNFIKNIKVNVVFEKDIQKVLVDDVDYTPFLRTEETSTLASKISPFEELRSKVLKIQRDFANKYNCIIEGRDIGTVVLPNADVKFFVTAKEEVRAMRRYEQLKDKSLSYEEILKDLRERDYKDEHRVVAPLKIAEDSILLDTSNMTLEQTIDKCVNIIEQKINEKNKK